MSGTNGPIPEDRSVGAVGVNRVLDEVESRFSPDYGFRIACQQVFAVQIASEGDGIAASPIRIFVPDEPGKQAALGQVGSCERLANLFAEGERGGEFFHGDPQHCGHQAEQAQQILFSGIESAESGGQFAESSADKGHAQHLGRLFGAHSLVMARVAMRRNASLSHRDQCALHGANLLAHGAKRRVDEAQQAVGERSVALDQPGEEAQID